MTIQQLVKKSLVYVCESDLDGYGSIPVTEGLSLFTSHQQTDFVATIYHPVVCLILQGAKETTIGEQVVQFGQGESLIVSHTVPVVSRITQASPKKPYLALILDIDLSLVRGLYHEVGTLSTSESTTSALNVQFSEPELIDAVGRLFSLAQDPIQRQVLGPLILKEIHFRLLMAPNGSMLRKLLNLDSHASKIDKAITHLREHFRQPLSMPDLASHLGMSESSFYSSFKKVTNTTPLQYQKELRLIEAQRLLRSEATSVSSAAFHVGYESPTQFSREYSRKFGISPSEEN